MTLPEKRFITAEDLYEFQPISDCQISPDGRHVLFCAQWVDRKTEKKYTNLWLASTADEKASRFTYGDQVDTHPRWSPDGRLIAFISNRHDQDRSQIYLLPFQGGEARPLTDLNGTISAFEWSPDGTRLVLQFRRKDQGQIEREADEAKKKLGVVARHITRTFYKLDGEGYLPQERYHLCLIEVESGQVSQLTDGAIHDEIEPRWSPDGQSILFRSNRSDEPDLNPDADDLFLIPASGGETVRLTTPFGRKSLPAFSPDGQLVAYFGVEGVGDWWKNNRLWVVPTDNSGPARNLTAAFDFDIASSVLGDLGSAAFVPPTWSNDGQRIYFQVGQYGNGMLRSIGLDGEELRTIVGEDGALGVYTFDQAQTHLAYHQLNRTTPGQICLRSLADGWSKTLANLNQALLAAVDLGQIEEVWFKGAAENDLQGWILKPPGFDAAQTYPAIIEMHGGPLAQYGNIFMHEFYFLAANGYVVAFCNPRGGQGYGEAHARSIWNAWGKADYEDVMAWTHFIAAKPYVDAARMGVTGGSYGGFLTNWIIGQTDHFKAAVTQRSVSNQLSAWGSSDFNWIFQQEIGENQPPWENFALYWAQSPMKYIGRAKTPTLVIHSEQDLRCVLEQGEQIYVALKWLGVDTELVIFPDEPHGLSRTGRTDRRIVRLKHILRWFDRYLKGSNDGSTDQS